MPVYEYFCKSCEKEFSLLQKFSDPNPEECDCGEKGKIEKLISKSAFHLKGSGWYVTDSKGAKASASNKPVKKEAASPACASVCGEGKGCALSS